jgi:predicted 2-oxoglutarate/Fe(II)-dependent dioxygenase YbiX/peroxiredoxin
MTDKLPRIFVQIASYRDPECQWTIKDLFAKASHPERITIGVCWQYIPGEDDGLLVNDTRPDQVRIMEVPAAESKGVCWARRETQKLWQGEEYTLVTDSHMRFIQGWDDALLEQLHACPAPKPLLSCNPASYTPPDNLQENPKPTIRRAGFFLPTGEMRCKGVPLDREPPHPLKGAFVAAGLMFSSAKVIEEVPYDPHLYFNQEEITYAARLWTHGWEIFHPAKVVSYHYYVNTGEAKPTKPLHWRDNESWQRAQQIGLARYNHLFRHTLSQDPDVLAELDRYGMGTARGLDEYEDYCGLNFRNKTVAERAVRGTFIEKAQEYSERGLRVTELDGTVKDEKALAQLVPDGENTSPQPLMARGDIMPFFVLPDHEGKEREIHLYAGKPVLLHFLPNNDRIISEAVRALAPHRKAYADRNVAVLFIITVPHTELADVKTRTNLVNAAMADEGGILCHALGLSRKPAATATPTAMLLTQNLKVRHLHQSWEGQFDHEALLKHADALTKPEEINIVPQAPVLVVPEALPPELCKALIAEWENGRRFEGRVGASENSIYRQSSKIRTDVMVSDELLAKVDETLSRTLLPEIEKAFHIFPTHRERYKIGCYDAERGGFFTQHRDNFDEALAYRLFALTLNLNGDFDGGEVNFPEYGSRLYKPSAGSAVIFPCDLMHQATKVTSGSRFMLVTFFYTEAGEALRQQERTKAGLELYNAEYAIRANRPFVGVKQRRGTCKTASELTAAGPAALPTKTVETEAVIPPAHGLKGLHSNLLLAPQTVDFSSRRKDVPPEVLIIDGFLAPEECKKLIDYADAKTSHALSVLDNAKTDNKQVAIRKSDARITDNVYIDDMSPEILTLFLNIYGHQVQPFYNTKIEWFERPQILKYGPGGKYDQHADAEHFNREKQEWVRSLDRDYSVLLYLNDEYEGGELEFVSFKYRFKPTRGMLVAFPADHRYLHAALPTTSGLRYVIVSWAAALGVRKVRESAPYAATFMSLKRNNNS